MKKSFILLIIFFLFFSCEENSKVKDKIVTEFPINAELKSEITEVLPIIMNPGNLFITGDYLVFFNSKKDTIFDFFNIPQLEYVFSDGVDGMGPNDFLSLDKKFFISTHNGFKTFSTDIGILSEVMIDSCKLKITKKIKFDFESYPVNGFKQMNDSLFFYWSGLDKIDEYSALNTNTKKEFSFSPYPKLTGEKLNSEKTPFVYVKNSVVKPDGKRFASFYGFFKHIRIYDSNGNMVRDISVNINPFNTSIENSAYDRLVSYYAYPYATNEYIYVLCKNDIFKSEKGKKTELQIWKWDGTPVASYTLDRYISMFTISIENKKLYALTGEDDDKIYTYELPIY